MVARLRFREVTCKMASANRTETMASAECTVLNAVLLSGFSRMFLIRVIQMKMVQAAAARRITASIRFTAHLIVTSRCVCAARSRYTGLRPRPGKDLLLQFNAGPGRARISEIGGTGTSPDNNDRRYGWDSLNVFR